MLATMVPAYGDPWIMICDGKCNKAWGISDRPRVYLRGEDVDPDDIAYLADDEVGEAPEISATSEGGHRKPTHPDDRHNKWCFRQCERCERSYTFEETIFLRDFSKRHYNIPSSDPERG